MKNQRELSRLNQKLRDRYYERVEMKMRPTRKQKRAASRELQFIGEYGHIFQRKIFLDVFGRDIGKYRQMRKREEKEFLRRWGDK